MAHPTDRAQTTGPAGRRQSSPTQPIDPAKLVRLMLAFFGDREVTLARAVAPASIPEPYRQLLAHTGHMTEALESHHGGALSVHPYRIRREGDIFGRRIDPHAAGRAGPVMTGIMIVNLALVWAKVRNEIVAAAAPLGEILIRHRILRRVSSDAFLEFDPADPLVLRFGLPAPRAAYGRLATIDCDQRPAVDLLETVRPYFSCALTGCKSTVRTGWVYAARCTRESRSCFGPFSACRPEAEMLHRRTAAAS